MIYQKFPIFEQVKVGVLPGPTSQNLKQKSVLLVTSDACKHYTEFGQDLMCIGGDIGKGAFINKISPNLTPSKLS